MFRSDVGALAQTWTGPRGESWLTVNEAEHFAEATAANVPNSGVFVFDRGFTIKFVDGDVVRRLGFEPDDNGKRLPDLLSSQTWQRMHPLYRRCLSERFTTDYFNAIGRDYRVHGVPVVDDGEVVGGLLICHEKATPGEERLAAELAQQSAVAELGRSAVDPDTSFEDLVELATRLAATTVDASGAALIVLDRNENSMEVRADYPRRIAGERLPYRGSLAEAVVTRRGAVLIDETLGVAARQASPELSALGARSAVSVPIGPMDDPFATLTVFSTDPARFGRDAVQFFESVATIVSGARSLEDANARLVEQAMHDPVTRLPNRLLIHDRLRQALSLGKRAKTLVGVLFVDLDDFKLINDSLGHHAGDAVLRTVADRLRRSVRTSDTVGRLGGDEFVIVANSVEDERDVQRISAVVTASLGEPILVGDEVVHVGASVGTAVSVPAIDTSPDVLIREADASMYRAKARGASRHDVSDTKISSLSHLEQFPIDLVKIDRTLIDGGDDEFDHRDAAMATAILAMCAATGKRVIAVGVERRSQAQRLKAMGCEFGQRYLFSSALPKERFDDWSRGHTTALDSIAEALTV